MHGRGLALLATLALVPPALALPYVDPQDDAGSGGDAPGTLADGLLVGPGRYEGRVDPVGGGLLPGGDDVDVYLVDVPPGARLEVELARKEGLLYGFLLAEIRDPAGRLVDWGIEDLPASGLPSAGRWVVRIVGSDAPVEYAFEVRLVASPPVHAVLLGNGWLGVEFTIGESGGRVNLSSLAMGSAAAFQTAMTCDYATTPGFGYGGCMSMGTNGPNVVATAGPLHVQHSVETDGEGGWMKSGFYAEVGAPGVYRLALMGMATESAFVVTIEADGDVRLTAPTAGGEEDLVALRHGEFGGGVAVRAGPASAGAGEARSLAVDGTLFAFLDCQEAVAACAIEDPAGGSEPAVPFGFVVGGGAGGWTFRRETIAGWSPDRIALLAADVRFPTG